VTHVSGCRGVSTGQSILHALDLQNAAQVGTAGDQQLPVPVLARHPHLEPHLGLNEAVRAAEFRLIASRRQDADFFEVDSGAGSFGEVQCLERVTSQPISSHRAGEIVSATRAPHGQKNHEQG
jgi:hypothetical protein